MFGKSAALTAVGLVAQDACPIVLAPEQTYVELLHVECFLLGGPELNQNASATRRRNAVLAAEGAVVLALADVVWHRIGSQPHVGIEFAHLAQLCPALAQRCDGTALTFFSDVKTFRK